jgi:hypothetical protein
MPSPHPFDDPEATPEFDEMIRELDALLAEDDAGASQPSLEDLFLARLGATLRPSAGAPPTS